MIATVEPKETEFVHLFTHLSLGGGIALSVFIVVVGWLVYTLIKGMLNL